MTAVWRDIGHFNLEHPVKNGTLVDIDIDILRSRIREYHGSGAGLVGILLRGEEHAVSLDTDVINPLRIGSRAQLSAMRGVVDGISQAIFSGILADFQSHGLDTRYRRFLTATHKSEGRSQKSKN